MFSHSLHLRQLPFLSKEDVWTEGVPPFLSKEDVWTEGVPPLLSALRPSYPWALWQLVHVWGSPPRRPRFDTLVTPKLC